MIDTSDRAPHFESEVARLHTDLAAAKAKIAELQDAGEEIARSLDAEIDARDAANARADAAERALEEVRHQLAARGQGL